MANLTSRQEGLSRIKSLEHDNQHQGWSGGKVPVKSFASGARPTSKGLKLNPMNGGGINRALRGTKQHTNKQMANQ